jgi:hypothetical protein
VAAPGPLDRSASETSITDLRAYQPCIGLAPRQAATPPAASAEYRGINDAAPVYAVWDRDGSDPGAREEQ